MTILEKLANIQAELKAPKSQWNEFGRYNYRNCEDILEAVKPICKKYNTVLILTDEVVMIGERYYVKARAVLNDLEGEGENMIDVSAYAREEESKKGMDGSQVTGASSSYARKYALNGLFNIDDTKDSDTTNKGEKGENSHQAPRGGQAGQTAQRPTAPAPARTQTGRNATQSGNAQAGPKMTLDEAMNFTLKTGKHAGEKFKDVPIDYLRWCIDFMTGVAQVAAKIVVEYADTRQKKGNGQMSVYDDDGDIPF